MKHWKETCEIVDRVAAVVSAGRRAALATVVRISGSSYRRPGAKFLVEDDGRTLGGVSGGCLEGDVREMALAVMRTGASRLLHYETGADDRTSWGLGLGCTGSVDIFVQPAGELPVNEVRLALHAIRDKAAGRFAIATLIAAPDGPGHSILVDAGGAPSSSTGLPDLDRDIARLARARLEAGGSQLDDVDGRLVFTDVLNAPPHLLVCGAGDDARPLVAYAADVGFAVTVVDHRPAYLTPERFPAALRLLELRPESGVGGLGINSSTFAVIKTHSFGHDREWARRFLEAGVAYIGVLGPRARKEQITEQIGAEARQLSGPVGLSIGAEGPEQIAISIVAELLAVRARRDPWHQREKREAIHAG